MPKCLPKERSIEFHRVITLGSNPGFICLDDGRVLRAAAYLNDTGRQPDIGDVFIEGRLITVDAFLERFEEVDPIESLQCIEALVDQVGFAHAGSATICTLTLVDGIHVVGSANPPVSDFLTSDEGNELAYADAIRNLAVLESHRLARRKAAQESTGDTKDLSAHG